MTSILVVRQKQTGEYLRMSKFCPVTQEPLYGPLEMAWLADNAPQALTQAGLLGTGDDHEAVRVTFEGASGVRQGPNAEVLVQG